MAKLNDLRKALETSKTLRLAKVDKEIVNDIIYNHIAIHKAVADIDNEIDLTRKGFLNGLDERVEQREKLQQQVNLAETLLEQKALARQLNSEYTDVEEVLKKFNKYLIELADRDIEIKLKEIDREKFFACLKDAKPDYTAEDIVNMNIMLKN